MFELSVKCDYFKKVMSVLKDLTDEVEFVFQVPNKLFIRTTDINHVCMIELMFCSFDALKPVTTEIKLGINLEYMLNFLKMGGKDDTLIFTYDTGDVLNYQLIGSRKIKGQLKLQSNEHLELPEPSFDYSTTLQLDSSDFEKTSRDIVGIVKDCKLTVKNGELSFFFEGPSGNGTISVDVNDTTANEHVTVSCLFLMHISKCSKLTDSFSLRIQEGAPLCCEYALQDEGYLKFYIAPKMDDNE